MLLAFAFSLARLALAFFVVVLAAALLADRMHWRALRCCIVSSGLIDGTGGAGGNGKDGDEGEGEGPRSSSPLSP